MNLTKAEIRKEYVIRDIAIDDEELEDFLFTLGCYSGETIAVIANLKNSYTVAIKDGRYNIDKGLAKQIII